ncbi:MAG TPA: phosphatase PAP2 family protein, partial [Flavisolibacter sp.]|nr:phosphatase PAP2 family protein [Flavisolibacter sp.]
FIIVNIIGWLGYYFIPAAPPWYVAEYGFNFNPHTPGHTAGLVRFDNFFGVKIFQSIYEKSSNVFAAMPSLHAAYTFIVVFFSYWLRMKKWLIVSSIAVIGIWFGAVYTSHHYVLDVIAGILAAILAVFIFRYFATTATGRRIVNKLVAASS